MVTQCVLTHLFISWFHCFANHIYFHKCFLKNEAVNKLDKIKINSIVKLLYKRIY